MTPEIRRLLDQWRQKGTHTWGLVTNPVYLECASQLEAALLALPGDRPPPEAETEEDLARVDRSPLSRWQDLPRSPQSGGSPLGQAVLDYMAVCMGMSDVATDQQQNWIAGHMATFASQVLGATTGVIAVDPVAETGTEGTTRAKSFSSNSLQPPSLPPGAAPPPEKAEV